MGWTVSDIAGAVGRAHTEMGRLEQELNAADAKLGDGDTGGMLKRVLDRMAALDLSGVEDAGSALSQLARAAAAATGSSLGTLLATALLTMSRELKGQAEVDPSSLDGLLAGARDAMMARGKAELGDKTVLDSIEAVIVALRSHGGGDVGPVVIGAARDALDQYRDRTNKRGRARMFGDATVGMDDPGMLAFKELVEAMAR
ncbi:DAK2 domain-containing protein [Pelagibacterium montanilacus]|uniref:DAK2 domain-containing protein n=1 Tax=Pelagibacterium montanilacus TaxID=2185280 RepID=UPI000F8CB35F|nr:DAK2 domain-containing protein [Pelagibacterium montanilacus]